MKYDHSKIEKRWQKKWEELDLYRAKDDSSKPKKYILDMFPYPSGAGLHVGHVEGYTATDVYSRYMRMKGFEVLHPMGWDAFGLPAENYAVKTKTPPQKSTDEAIQNFTRQIKSLGLSYDWSREIGTHTPEYYKWTQWFFLFLYKQGLAYKAKAKVNWCPKDQTVLANEQVVDGKCERCGTEVIQKDLEQWFFKITKYADDLISGLDTIDWPESTKIAQRNWIGRSEGAEFDFKLNIQPPTEIVFATNNDGKRRRMEKLFAAAGINIVLKTPKEIGITGFDVVEDGKTLAENAEKKARAIAEKTNLPILSDDSGFFIDGTELDPVTVKRNALEGLDEHTLSVEEIGQKMQDYYANIAKTRGGKVEAQWHNALCLITPDKKVVHIEPIRPVVLTAEPHGTMDPHLPLRPLYISIATGKYVLEQTDEEELKELQPITDSLKKLFAPAITVFTTRPDTLYGATYLVLAPEHGIISDIKSQISNVGEVEKYLEETKKRTDSERLAEGKEKTGVELKGIKAINPANGEEIPIFIADYVLGHYGTGAIMAVPAHDERDFEFAKKFDLPIRTVLEPETGKKLPNEQYRSSIVAIVEDPKTSTFLTINWGPKLGGVLFIGGGREEGEDVVTTAKREIAEETGYTNLTFVGKTEKMHHHYFAFSKNVARNIDVVGLHFKLENSEQSDTNHQEDEEGNFTVEWHTKENILKKIEDENHLLCFDLLVQGVIYTGAGILTNSGEFNDIDSEEAKTKITEKFGRKKITYRLRDWLISRQRYWGSPIPIIYCDTCALSDPAGRGEHPVPEDQLPVMLPTDVDFMPHGESPLARSKSFHEVGCPKCSAPARRESDTMDTFVCSSWYYFRFADPHNSKEFADKEKMAHWLPVDLYVGGAEHTVLHLLYSRFFTKVLKEKEYISFDEPFTKLRHQGIILAEDGKKMSKSLGNVINPDDVIERYGADSLRLYEMFMGPLEQQKPWNTNNILGVRRFLERVWRMQEKVQGSTIELKVSSDLQTTNYSLQTLLHHTVKKVGEDIEQMKFNTAISSLMILLNEMEKIETVSRDTYGTFLVLLSPLAPHMTEELWEAAGEKNSIHEAAWPHYDESKLVSDVVTMSIQINGKTREHMEVEHSLSQEEVEKRAREALGARLEGKSVIRVVVVPGRLVNIVVAEG